MSFVSARTVGDDLVRVWGGAAGASREWTRLVLGDVAEDGPLVASARFVAISAIGFFSPSRGSR